MNKTVIFVSLFCISFTCWWAWRLDAGPFIYRHTVPEKLTQKVTETFLPYLKGRSIEKIQFGKKNAHVSQKVPAIVEAEAVEEWLISNPSTGPVLLNVDLDDGEISIYWDVPEDMPFDQSFSMLSQTLWDILVQYDQIIKVQNTYQ